MKMARSNPMKTTPIYAALDLHSTSSVLGSMDHEGNSLGQTRFATAVETLQEHVAALATERRPVHLTLEAGALTRWAVGILRPLVERLVICDPRHNRLINTNPNKRDELDVEGMCLLLRVGKLKEVWMGQDRTREIYRALVYELLNWPIEFEHTPATVARLDQDTHRPNETQDQRPR
jgi:hypothetical protein